MTLTRIRRDGSTKLVLLKWRRQPRDARDEAHQLKMPAGISSLPSSVDLRPVCSEVEDQGMLGSCTANAFAGAVEANEIAGNVNGMVAFARLGSPVVVVSNTAQADDGSVSFSVCVHPAAAPPPAPTPSPAPTPKAIMQVSRLFEYYGARKLEGSTQDDAGATIRDTVKAGAKYGIVDEAMWPYDPTKFSVDPPREIWNAAAKRKVSSYHSIADGDVATMKSSLASGRMVIYGFSVYSYFLSQDMAIKGYLDIPNTRESYMGGHAQCLVGYDDNMPNPFRATSRGAFLVRNSWGKDWGLGGYYWVSYDYLANTALAGDNWVIVSAPG